MSPYLAWWTIPLRTGGEGCQTDGWPLSNRCHSRTHVSILLGSRIAQVLDLKIRPFVCVECIVIERNLKYVNQNTGSVGTFYQWYFHSRPVLTEWAQNSLRHFMFTRDFRGVYALGVDWNWNNYMRLSLHKAKPQRASPGVNNTSHVRLSRWPWLRPCYYQPGLKRKKLDPLNIFSRCCLVWCCLVW